MKGHVRISSSQHGKREREREREIVPKRKQSNKDRGRDKMRKVAGTDDNACLDEQDEQDP